MNMQYISTLVAIVMIFANNCYSQTCIDGLQCPRGQWCNGGRCEPNPCAVNGTTTFCNGPADNRCNQIAAGCKCQIYSQVDAVYACLPIQYLESIGAAGSGSTSCLPSGCFYDVENDVTKKIECRKNGRQRILYYNGNNGCNNISHFLPESTYYSPQINPCCNQRTDAADAAVLTDGETQYYIYIHNTYGSTVKFGVFQVQPTTDEESYSGNYATVFTGFTAPTSATSSVHWPLDWGLSYSYGGDNCQPLTTNVVYTLTGDITSATPGDIANAAQLSYNEDDKAWSMVRSHLDLAFNQIGIDSLKFSNNDAIERCLTVSVTCEEEPVFVCNGEPRRYYHFTLKPQYYITTLDTKIGTTVSADIIGKSQFIDFSQGTTFRCEYNEFGEYVDCAYSN